MTNDKSELNPTTAPARLAVPDHKFLAEQIIAASHSHRQARVWRIATALQSIKTYLIHHLGPIASGGVVALCMAAYFSFLLPSPPSDRSNHELELYLANLEMHELWFLQDDLQSL